MSNPEIVITAPPQSVPDEVLTASDMVVEAARRADASTEIANILAELGQGPAPTPAAAPVVPPVVAPAPVIPAEVAPAPVTPPPAPVAEDRGMLRLLELEGQVRTRVEAAEARERALVDKERQLQEQYRNHFDPAEFARRFTLEPSKTLEALGISPEVASAMIVVDRLGDKAPQEARRLVDGASTKREIEQLRRQIQERDYYLAKERAFVGAKDFVGSTGTGESKYPTLTAVAAVNKDMVANAVLAEVESLARKPGFVLNQETYAAAASTVEKNWEVFSKAFTPKGPQTASTNVSEQAPATVSPASKSTQIAPPPAPPNPVTPAPAPVKVKRPYWEDPEWEAQKSTALAEALRDARNQPGS